MYASLTRVQTADQPTENATIVAEELVRWLRDIEGFEGFVMLSRPGTSVGISFWKDREVAEHHRAGRRTFVERMTSVAGVVVEEMIDFEVTFAQLGPWAKGL
jgi:hypothetical protein